VLLAQFGQHPVADGNLILLSKVIVNEINELHGPKWQDSD
jgi:hypothetical protein